MRRSGICLLEFSYGDKQFSYLERTGIVDGPEYCKKLGNGWAVVTFLVNHTRSEPADNQNWSECFNQNVVCSSRLPATNALTGSIPGLWKTPIFGDNVRWKGTLKKVLLMVESAAQANFQWIMDVLSTHELILHSTPRLPQ